MIHRYLDAGGNHIDTANVYAYGKSEEIVGSALQGRRDKVILASKVRFATGEGPNQSGLSRLHIFDAVEASLKRLGTGYLDLLYMHCWDPFTPLEESLHAFDDLVRMGKIRYVGVSNFKAWQLMKGLGLCSANGWVRFIAAQYQYSLVKRDIEYEFIDLCLSEGVGLTPWGPLGGGFLSGKYRADQRPTMASEGRLSTMPAETEESWTRRNTVRNWQVLEVIAKIAAELNVTAPQVAIAWLRHQPAVASVVLGARTMEQLEDNLKAGDLDLPGELLEGLNQVSALPEVYPYRFIKEYGSR
jgi:aryl-alcohol dehydrogenase-like predicted oxidoreductase